MPRTTFARVPWIALVACVILAPGGSGVTARAEETASPTLPVVREADLRRHLERLAADDFLGREAATEGARLAAAYIADEMMRVGVAPGGKEGTYFQPFTIPIPRLGEGNRLEVVTEEGSTGFDVEKEWNPFSVSANVEASGQVVFAGYGITAPERAWDDYAGIDVKSRVVLVYRKDPGWNDRKHAAFTAKLANAVEHGAAALLLCNDPQTVVKEKSDRIGHWSASIGGRPGSAEIPYAFIRQDVARHLLAELGTTLEALEKTLRDKGPRPMLLEKVRVAIRTSIARAGDGNARNVIGYLEGRDPEVADEIVVIGAHYDHLGFGRFGSTGGAAAAGKLHPGADDNASGTAAVIEIGEYFAAPENRPRRSLLFIAFTGEEKGLLGSSHYVAHPLAPLENTVAMVNMDMVGRNRDGGLYVGGVGTGKGLRAIVEAANADEGLTLSLGEGGAAPSDNLPFFRKRIPVLFFHTGGHEDYHRPSDTVDRINFPGLERVTRVVRNVTRELADRPERLVFTQPPPRVRPPLLGVGLDRKQDVKGVRISRVTDDGPAAKAGLAAGDVIVSLAGRPVTSTTDLRRILAGLEAGKAVDVVYVRGEERIESRIVPRKRGRR